jgi:hypothetical protein
MLTLTLADAVERVGGEPNSHSERDTENDFEEAEASLEKEFFRSAEKIAMKLKPEKGDGPQTITLSEAWEEMRQEETLVSSLLSLLEPYPGEDTTAWLAPLRGLELRIEWKDGKPKALCDQEILKSLVKRRQDTLSDGLRLLQILSARNGWIERGNTYVCMKSWFFDALLSYVVATRHAGLLGHLLTFARNLRDGQASMLSMPAYCVESLRRALADQGAIDLERMTARYRAQFVQLFNWLVLEVVRGNMLLGKDDNVLLCLQMLHVPPDSGEKDELALGLVTCINFSTDGAIAAGALIKSLALKSENWNICLDMWMAKALRQPLPSGEKTVALKETDSYAQQVGLAAAGMLLGCAPQLSGVGELDFFDTTGLFIGMVNTVTRKDFRNTAVVRLVLDLLGCLTKTTKLDTYGLGLRMLLWILGATDAGEYSSMRWDEYVPLRPKDLTEDGKLTWRHEPLHKMSALFDGLMRSKKT